MTSSNDPDTLSTGHRHGRPSPRINAPAWAALISLGPECWCTPALRCAMQGDRASIQALLSVGLKDPDSPLRSVELQRDPLSVVIQVQRSAGHAGAAPSHFAETVTGLSLPVIVAITLGRDRGHSETLLDRERIRQIIETSDNEKLRVRWQAEDRKLLESALSLWRNAPHLQGDLFVACARFVQCEDFMNCFVQQGVDFPGLLKYRQYHKLGTTDSTGERSVFAADWMLRTGNYAGLAVFLGQLGSHHSEPAIAPILRLRSAEASEAGRRIVANLLQDSQPREGNETSEPPVPLNERSAGLFKLLGALDKLSDGDETMDSLWIVRARLLGDYLRDARQDNKIPDAVLVGQLMDGVFSKGGTALAQRLRNPDLLGKIGPSGAPILDRLFTEAAAAHLPQLLRHGKHWIEHPARFTSMMDDLMDGAAMGREYPTGKNLDREAFIQTLDVLKTLSRSDQLMPLETKPAFLHRLAASLHPQRLEAFVAALEWGLDPDIRDVKGRKPSGLAGTATSDRKAAWLTAQYSATARIEAGKAIHELRNLMPSSSSSHSL